MLMWMLRTTGFRFYVKNGNLEIYNKVELRKTETYILESDTGLVKVEETTFESQLAYNVKTIFLPYLRAGEVIIVNADNGNSYKLLVISLSVSGNNYSSGFTTEILGILLDPKVKEPQSVS